VALAFQMRAIPKASLKTKVRSLTVDELAELDLATDEGDWSSRAAIRALRYAEHLSGSAQSGCIFASFLTGVRFFYVARLFVAAGGR